MLQIHRFEVPPGTPAGGGIGITMPSGAKVLHVSILSGRIGVHILLNTLNPLVVRRFVVFGDGMMIGAGPDGLTVDKMEHAGTVVVDLAHDKQIVMHVFDGGEVAAPQGS